MARYYKPREHMPKHNSRWAEMEPTGHSRASKQHTNAYSDQEPSPVTSGHMIHTEPDKTSGCPTDVKMITYPKVGSFMPYGLSWGIEPMDRQMQADTAKGGSILKPRKT